MDNNDLILQLEKYIKENPTLTNNMDTNLAKLEIIIYATEENHKNIPYVSPYAMGYLSGMQYALKILKGKANV